MGESQALEVNWTLPFKDKTTEHLSSYNVYEAEDEDKNPEEMQGLNHPHRVKDYNSEKYWGEIIMFLHNGNLPANKQIALQLINWARKFLLYEGGLWRRNGDKPILQVVLNQEIWNRVMHDAHDGSGHRGQDPMFQKIKDSYWWPNMS